MRIRTLFGLLVCALQVSGCPAAPGTEADGGSPGLDVPERLDGGDGGVVCRVDTDCDDGAFCNGDERCAPGATDADEEGCVLGTARCAADEDCDEAASTCNARCTDADDDGHGDVACGGDDCDDADANRFPGNPEVCDSTAHDEDCNQETFGFLDSDGDGVAAMVCCNVLSGGDLGCGGDCNDGDSVVNPRAGDGPPLFCDGVDNDCSGTSDEGCPCVEGETQECGTMAQLDRVGTCRPGTQVCSGGAFTETCIGAVPPAEEFCDGVDNDCDGTSDEGVLRTYYPDVDGDGFGLGSGTPVTACSAPAGYSSNGTDCDDVVASVNPGATEVCNGVDDNCFGGTDEGFTATFYRDGDGDGFGDLGMPMTACSPPAGYVRSSNDCDDTNASRSPVTVELCNGFDDNCNAMTDEGVLRTYYLDADRDGFGRDDSTMTACTPPAMHVDRGGDCADGDASINPAASELCNGRDDNCGGGTDTGCTCTDATSRSCGPPSETGECSFGRETCVAGTWASCVGAVTSVPEVCNGLDDDCNGVVDNGVTATGCYRDGDGDGFGTGGVTTQCRDASRTTFGFCPVGWVNNATDCNDGVSAIRPGAAETCDGIDQDCDGMADEGTTVACYLDADGDAFGTGSVVGRCADPARTAFGTCPSGYTNVATDCNDGNASVRPGATELCNGLDDNCGGGVDEGVTASGCYADGDSDGVGAGAATTQCRDAARSAQGFCPIGFTNVAGDCNNAIATIRPGAPELCNDLDDDCDSTIDDGFECRPGVTAPMACTTGCGSSGTRTCTPSCTFAACRTADEGPGVAGTCNACDDDLDGAADDNFACARGTLLPCTTSCGTPGTRACSSSCTVPSACVAAVEACNFCDDDGDGTLHDDQFVAVDTIVEEVTSCASIANDYYGDCGPRNYDLDTYYGSDVSPRDVWDVIGPQSFAAWRVAPIRIGWGRVTFQATLLPVDFGTYPGRGWSVVLASGGTGLGSAGVDEVGAPIGRASIALEWSYHQDGNVTSETDQWRVMRYDPVAGNRRVTSWTNTPLGLDRFSDGYPIQVTLDYTPDSPLTSADEETLTVTVDGGGTMTLPGVWLNDVFTPGGSVSLGVTARTESGAGAGLYWIFDAPGTPATVATVRGICPIPDGTLRLVDGPSTTAGRLEIFHSSTWGTVCDDAFTSVDATVACRQLGLTGGTTMTATLLGAGPIWLDDVGCGGSETALTSCSNLGWGVHNCSHSEDTWVTCSP